MPAPFSRLQLAAALIEYDNDSEDPETPRRSAQESAIFAHLRRNPATRPDLRKSSKQLGASQNVPDSVADTKRSRASRGSLDALRNPFGADEMSEFDEDEDEQTELEVDLSSWGLDAFIPKEKPEKSKKGKEKQGSVAVRSRTVSGGPQEIGEMGNAVAHSRAASAMNMRRQSTSSRLDFAEDSVGDDAFRKRRAMSQSFMSIQGHDGTIPFPSPRPQSPGGGAYGGIDSTLEQQYPPRSQSRASLPSRQVLDDPLDPRLRTTSQGTIPPDQPTAQDNPFALRAPTTYTSRFDPKAVHTRTYSTASRGTQQLLGNDDAESIKSGGRDRPYSVVELLRPKVLVMPSPLQNAGLDTAGQPYVREGFQSSRDGPPLPPGARTTRRLSTSLDAVPNPTNSFIPNATADLSLAQRVFRDTLNPHNGGYPSTSAVLPRAHADGEQVEFEPPPPEEEEVGFFGDGVGKPNKPAGKLYGKSLIDDLENRKAQMRNKQRVFAGDQRPTMMARQSNRSSTLIDPASLNERPGTHRQSSYGSQPGAPGLSRRGSIGAKPFLSFDEESKHHQLQPGERIPKNKSVFGVDTLWESEMAKLRILEEQEKIDMEERRKTEEEEARRQSEKRRSRKKLRKKGAPPRPEDLEAEEAGRSEGDLPTTSTTKVPPVLPDIDPATARRKAPAADESDDESSESDEEQVAQPPRRTVAAAWHSDSEDEKPTGPVRTTGVGLRNPIHVQRQSDSEEDIPLAAAKERVASRYTKSLANQLDSDDEDKPLARVIQEKVKSPILDIDFDQRHAADSDDEQPLGIRASTLMLNRNDDDDDKPLAFHPEQQRRTQYNVFAAQQQQNQLMMQAQFQNSMFFNPPMMTPPFFGPTVPPMMNQMPMAMMGAPIPMPIPSPPPMHDQNKFLSVDKWRRDVVVDGEQH